LISGVYFVRTNVDISTQNIQSTNWQTLRFKPPPPKSPIGWRVEFRSMEIQMTDFENASFVVFIVLLSRAIMSMNLNFYIPISKVSIPVTSPKSLTWIFGNAGRREHASRTATRRRQPSQVLFSPRNLYARIVARHVRRYDSRQRHSVLLSFLDLTHSRDRTV